MTFEEKYLHDSASLSKAPGPFTGRTAWECPSNVALVKYWGKRPVQLPMNPSVSFVLHAAKTRTTVDYRLGLKRSRLLLEFLFDGRQAKSFGDRVRKYLLQVMRYMPFLGRSELTIQTVNSFPHSAGIASSASSFGALALAVCSMERAVFGTPATSAEFLEKASFLARLGSGSACRSVFGGFSLWGKIQNLETSTDEAAIPLGPAINPVFQDMHDSILVVSSGAKKVSSSEGHRLMEDNPFSASRYAQARANAGEMLGILGNGDEKAFMMLAEEEALTLHAMMITSKPGYILLKPETLMVMDRIRKFRMDTGLPVCFTLDAGPNVHLLYPGRIAERVRSFISDELSRFCEKGFVIHDRIGAGPVMLDDTLPEL